MLPFGGLVPNVVDHFGDLSEIVVTLDVEAWIPGKRDCAEMLHRNTAITIGLLSLYTGEIVLESQTCYSLGTDYYFASHNLTWNIRM